MSVPAMPLWVAAALASVVLIASVRVLRRPHPHRGRQVAVVVLQALAAGLLYACLLPPSQRVPPSGLVVIGADAAAAGALPVGGTRVLLPEAAAMVGVERMPDLASALRRHPATTVTLAGAGLAARDRDTDLPADTRWLAAPAPRGWIALQPPADAAPGARIAVMAQARGVSQAQADLLDPAGAVVDRAPLTAEGRVQLSGTARAEGRSVFRLRLLDGQGHVVDSIPVPQQTRAVPRVRLLARASAPGPEWKYLRRWATDAGLTVQLQADTGAGLSIGDGVVALDAASLARADLLLLDERSLAALSAGQFAAVRQAVREGMGLLVRTTGVPSPSARQRLGGLGLPVQGDASSQVVQLPGEADAATLQARRGPQAGSTLPTPAGEEADRSSHTAALPGLEQLALQVPDSQALLQDRSGRAIGGWRASGRGRVGLLPLTDSWRWVLAGREERHGELWSEVFATLARAQPGGDGLWSPQPLAWMGERHTLCGAQAGLRAFDADGRATPLPADPASGAMHCAAWWPRTSGWHRLQQGDRIAWRYVFDAKDAPMLHRQAVIDATSKRLAMAATTSSRATQRVPGPRWPWWLAFVLCASLLWWLERRR